MKSAVKIIEKHPYKSSLLLGLQASSLQPLYKETHPQAYAKYSECKFQNIFFPGQLSGAASEYNNTSPFYSYTYINLIAWLQLIVTIFSCVISKIEICKLVM